MKRGFKPKHDARAFTLVELALVVLIFGISYGMLMPAFNHFADEAKIKTTEETVKELGVQIDAFYKTNGHYPDTLLEVFGYVPTDQWGNPYQYLRIDGGSVVDKGKIRKDKNLVPINSDYDLYSKGPDGQSVSPLTATTSKDDIVRGRNGDYIGLAESF